jgi:hypothetical protein
MMIPQRVFGIGNVAAGESARFAIVGVRVFRAEDGGCVAQATNGKRAGELRWRDDEWRKDARLGATGEAVPGWELLVPLATWRAVGKAVKMRSRASWCGYAHFDEATTDTVRAYVLNQNKQRQTFEAAPDEGRWPDVEGCLRAEYDVGTRAVRVGVDPRLLADLLDVLTQVTDCETKGVALTLDATGRQNAPIMFHVVNGAGTERGIGVLMPVNLTSMRQSEKTMQGPVTVADGLARVLARAVHSLTGEDAKRARAVLAEAGWTHEHVEAQKGVVV